VGVQEVMANKTTIQQWNWSLGPFLNDSFKDEMKNVKRSLFVDDFVKLLPDRP
jgi:hypothetical protein